MALRIAQVAPLTERVPPQLYGGTERVVSVLTEELVRRGHHVTLFASGDSVTKAHLVPVTGGSLRLSGSAADPLVHTMVQLGMVFEHAGEFDVIHNHLDYMALPFTRLVRTPVVTTMHGRLDLPDLPAVMGAYPEAHLVSVSDRQRQPLPEAGWVATVYNGLDLSLFRFEDRVGDYFTFVGRISPEKNLEGAIAISRHTGIPLRIAAKVDRVDVDYYESVIAPLIDGRHVEYLGELGDEDKSVLLGGARALLFPVAWPEPFGLAMTEAMACGTPVLALDVGSIPEVVADGVTGFIGASVDELVQVADRVEQLDRQACRTRVEDCFSSGAMADGYEAVYRALAPPRVRFDDLLPDRSPAVASLLPADSA